MRMRGAAGVHVHLPFCNRDVAWLSTKTGQPYRLLSEAE
jgi:hypothetical protein